MAKHHIPGPALGVVSNGHIEMEKGYSVRNIKTKQPVTDRSVFYTDSISKIFTTQCILNLARDGKLKLESKAKDLHLKYPGKRRDSSVGSMIPHPMGRKISAMHQHGDRSHTYILNPSIHFWMALVASAGPWRRKRFPEPLAGQW